MAGTGESIEETLESVKDIDNDENLKVNDDDPTSIKERKRFFKILHECVNLLGDMTDNG